MRPELERFAMFAYDALQNDGWDDIEVDYYHSDIPPHDVYGVPIKLIKRGIDEDGEACVKYFLLLSGFCHRIDDELYRMRLGSARDPYEYEKDYMYSFDEFKKCYEEALAIVKRDNIKESLDFVDAIDFAKNLRPYEEGLGDVAHKIGTGIKNFFGTKAGAAQRAAADAQTAQQTAQNQAAANQANANLVSAQQAAQQILKTLQNDITKTKVGNVVKGAGKAVANGAKNLAKAGVAAGAKMMGGNEIDQQQAANTVDNAVQGAKDLKNKVSNAAHGEAKTASEQENAKNQRNGGDE